MLPPNGASIPQIPPSENARQLMLFRNQTLALLLAVSLSLSACAGPKPILQSNAHLMTTGEPLAQEAISECTQKAEKEQIDPGETRGQKIAQGAALYALGGAVIGAVGGITSGMSAIAALIAGSVLGLVGGVAGAMSPLDPNSDYAAYFGACLKKNGYELKGWH